MAEARIQKVIRRHNCYSDRCKRLHKGDNRINFEMHNYCLVCGYKVIKKNIYELENFLKYLKRKHIKELVLGRLQNG